MLVWVARPDCGHYVRYCCAGDLAKQLAGTTVFTEVESFDISNRLRRTTAFKDYLEARWNSENFQQSYYNFSGVLSAGAGSFDSVRTYVARGPKIRSRPRWRR